MLTELVVEQLGVIERADLTFGPGESALTGETGAGKTLLVAALSLLCGGRADRFLVRSGAEEARVEGRFTVRPSHPAARLLKARGALEEDAAPTEIVVARSIGAEGRAGRARVNGHLVTVALLGELGALLVAIAGQRDHAWLADPGWQRRALDSYAGDEVPGLAAAVADEVTTAEAARRQASELAASERERARELDALRHESDEIAAAAIEVGETERLTADARRLGNAEAIAAGVSRAVEALRGEEGAQDLLVAAGRELDALTADDPALARAARRLEGAAVEVDDVATELRAALVEPDPQALELTRARLQALARLRAKYGEDEGAVLAYAARAATRIEELERAEDSLAAVEQEVACHAAEAERLAGELSRHRAAAAPILARAIEERLSHLALPAAQVEIRLVPHALNEGGAEGVELRFEAHSGEAPKPVGKVASGGELSRIALAVVLVTSGGDVETMVFDEVDAGVGGAAAQAVGRALADVARVRSAQVLVVTHLPQVAAFADTHFCVTKAEDGDRADARVRRLEDATTRVEELSRMLSGLPHSSRARDHARELLELAARTAS